MASPTKQQLEHQYRMRKLRLFQQICMYATSAWIVYIGFHYVYLSVRELAGRETTTSILLSLYGFLKAPRAVAIAIAYLLAALASAWGIGERRGKKRAIERLHPMARQAQLMIDAKKGSSNITLQGDTGPEDL